MRAFKDSIDARHGAGILPAMKALILLMAVVLVGGCASGNSAKAKAAIELAIREELKKPTGILTKVDYEKVTAVSFHRMQLTEIPEVLEKLTQLKVLGLRINELTDIKGLEKSKQLKGLGLGRNKLTSVKGLENLTNLEALTLEDNQLTSVKGLEKLPQLWFLSLSKNKLTSVKDLEKLTQLKYLNIMNNPALTRAQIDELKKALPKCKSTAASAIELVVKKNHARRSCHRNPPSAASPLEPTKTNAPPASRAPLTPATAQVSFRP
tara:strand:- start:701 stop:1498 length:798 start_codon:yes stop_codon:yes gene_type:complete